MDTKDMIINTLQKNKSMMKAKEIIQITGIEKKEIDKAIKILKKTNIISSPKACYYAITDE